MIDDTTIESAPDRKKKSYASPKLRDLDAVEDTSGKAAISLVEAGAYTNPS
jgi:hypothetical protein